MKRFPLVAIVITLLMAGGAVAQKSSVPAAATADKAPAASTPDAAAEKPAEEKAQPGTAAADKDASSTEVMDPNDPLFGVPPLPKGKVSLIGGTVQKIDRVRNRVTVKTFGDAGKKMKVTFDERTHIYRDGVETTERGIRPGDRVYVDTMLDGVRLLARNIRVVTSLKPSDAEGQIAAYNPRNGIMTVRDELSNTPVTFRISKDTKVNGGGGQGTIELVPGSLVTVKFSPGQRNRDMAREITILAMPGNTFNFAGKVRFLDMSKGIIAVENLADNKTYELQFQPGVVRDDVTVGSDVTVSALFSGKGYRAQSIAVNQAKD